MTSLLRHFEPMARWSHKKKLALAAGIAFSSLGGSAAAFHHVNNGVSDQAARDQEWKTLQAEVSGVVTAEKQLETLDTLKNMLNSPGTLTTGIDAKQMEKDRERLQTAYYSQDGKLVDDIIFARDLSLNDMGSIRDRMRRETHGDHIVTDGYFDDVIRGCQNKVMSKPDFKRSPESGGEIDNCIYSNAGGMTGHTVSEFMLILSSFACVITTGMLAKQTNKESSVEPVAERPRVEVAPVPAMVQEVPSEPMALDAPARILRPLKLKLKPQC